jgi:hypothetical protein
LFEKAFCFTKIFGLVLLVSIFGCSKHVIVKTVPSQETLDHKIKKIHQQVCKLRGYANCHQVPATFLADKEFNQKLSPKEKDNSKEDNSFCRRWTIGFFGDKFASKLKDKISSPEERVSSIAGFYSIKEKAIYVRKPSTKREDDDIEYTLAHEFTHSFQDQFWGLKKIYQDSDPEKDLAVDGLIEGDAILAAYIHSYLAYKNNYAKRSLQKNINRAMKKIWRYLPRQDEIRGMAVSSMAENKGCSSDPLTLYKYLSGANFTVALFEQGGFEAINHAFRHPPHSSEQILDVDTYFMGEKPYKIDPLPLPARSRQLCQGQMGSFYSHILLSDFFYQSNLHEMSASGWGGDRYMFTQANGEKPTFSWLLVSDTNADADVVETILQKAIEARKDDPSQNKPRLEYQRAGKRLAMVVGYNQDSYAPHLDKLLKVGFSQEPDQPVANLTNDFFKKVRERQATREKKKRRILAKYLVKKKFEENIIKELNCPENTRPAGEFPPKGHEKYCALIDTGKKVIKHGPAIQLFDNQSPASNGNYKQGQRDGHWKFFFKNGKLRLDAHYKQGKPVGTWTFYSKKGDILKEVEH